MAMAISALITKLINYKAWANKGIYSALDEAQPRMTEDFPVAVAILDHTHAVDCIFRAHLTGAAHSYAAARSACQPLFAELSAMAAATDDWYVSYVRSVSDDALEQKIDFQFTDGQPAKLSRAEMLLHVVNHGTYHRGNVGIIMQKNGLMPNKDVLTNFLLGSGV